MLRQIGGDLRMAARISLRRPWMAVGYASIVGLTLALVAPLAGLARAILFDTRGWPHAERLFAVHAVDESAPRGRVGLAVDNSQGRVSRLVWSELEHVGVFESVGVWIPRTYYLGTDRSEIVETMSISASVPQLLGLRAMVGRSFTPLEDSVISDGVILSFRCWQTRFGGAEDVVGKKLVFAGAPNVRGFERTVLGVYTDGVVPAQQTPEFFFPVGGEGTTDESATLFRVLALLREQVPLDQAEARAVALIQQYDRSGRSARLNRLTVDRIELLVAPAWLLLGASLAFLLVAATNLVGLQLSDSGRRRQAIAIRSAMGATVPRLVWFVVAENLLLSLPAGSLAAVLVHLTVPVVARWLPQETPSVGTGVSGVATTAAVMAAALLIGAFIGLLLSAQLVRSGTLREDAGHDGARVALGAQRVVIVLVLAMTLGPLACAVSFGSVLANLASRELGFDPGGVAVIEFTQTRDPRVTTVSALVPRTAAPGPPAGGSPPKLSAAEAAASLWATWEHTAGGLAAVSGVRGVVAVAASNTVPFATRVSEETVSWSGGSRLARTSIVTESYFEALRIPVVNGRTLLAADRGTRRVLISVRLAGLLEGTGLGLNDQILVGDEEVVVVGVVGNLRASRHDIADVPAVYRLDRTFDSVNSIVLRAEDGQPVAPLLPAVRDVIRRYDPQMVIRNTALLTDVVVASRAAERLWARLSAAVGVGAVILSLVACYGLTASHLQARRTELAVRGALGASPAGLRMFVIRGAASTIAPGLVLGLPLAWTLLRAISASFHEAGDVAAPSLLLSFVVLGAGCIASAAIVSLRTSRLKYSELLNGQE